MYCDRKRVTRKGIKASRQQEAQKHADIPILLTIRYAEHYMRQAPHSPERTSGSTLVYSRSTHRNNSARSME
jgi:hypothetical protein